jgi:hypothetical protein
MVGVVNQKRLEEYLANAAEAQALADSFPDTDSFFKTSWLAIAHGYRVMAEAERPSAPSSGQP